MSNHAFPIQVERGNPSPVRSVPWSVAERAYGGYAAEFGTGQTMERLAQRGGFAPSEMDRFAPGWREEVSELVQVKERLARLGWGVVHNAGRLAREAGPRWWHVSEAVGIGSSSATLLCREHGADPDEIIPSPAAEDVSP